MARTRGAIAYLVLTAGLAASVVSAPQVGAASTSRATDLGTLGGASSQATALNDSGQVVGWATLAGGHVHAFSWTSTGGMVDLGTLGGATSYAADVNSGGMVVGYADTADGATHAFSWTSTGGMVDLGALGRMSSSATAVNDHGIVVGGADVADGGGYHAFLWKPGDPAMTDLGTLGGAFSSSSAVSETGQIVGTAADESGSPHAFSWTASGGMVDVEPARYSAAVAVSPVGQVVGFAYSADFSYTRAFSWTAAGGLTDVDTLGGQSSYAFAVGDTGEVVGSSQRSDGSQHAFSWTSESGLSDLGTLGGTFSGALHVNAVGQIVGYATTAASEQHAFLRDGAGPLIDLGTLGGPSSAAVDINSTGDAVGWASTAGGTTHAALFSTSLYQRMQEVADGLPATPRLFSDARARLAESLNPALWNAAGTALTYPNGARFFDLVKQAVDRLDRLNSDEAHEAIADLWTISERLTAQAVDDASSTPGATVNAVNLAKRQLASASGRWAVDHSDAFERLKEAWRSAEGVVH